MDDFNAKYNNIKKRFEDKYVDFLANLKGIPEPLISSMRYSALLGGKRIRPILLLASNEIFNEDDSQAIDFAIAVELIHTYSLIHDDLPCMDNDKLRRGKPTNHIVYGEGMAVLAGDALLNLAFELMLNSADKNNTVNAVKTASYIGKAVGGCGMIAGQCADIENENTNTNDEKLLKYLHSNKTGKLFNASVVSGGLINGTNADALKTLESYSENLGMVFQITDDILDIVGNTAEMGKSIGKDISKSKLTYPKLYGIEKCKLIAEEYTQKAINSIKSINGDTSFFQNLSVFVLNRTK